MLAQVKPQLKELPTAPTKDLIKKMFPRQNHEKLMRRVNAILKENRKFFFKKDKILTKKEFCLLLIETGPPPRYSSFFEDKTSLKDTIEDVRRNEPSRFLTAENKEVTSYILRGQTKIFVNKELADTYARKIGSYTYDLYCEINKKKEVYGYAVPK